MLRNEAEISIINDSFEIQENILLTSSTDEIVSAFTTDETFDNNTEDTIAFESTTLALPATVGYYV